MDEIKRTFTKVVAIIESENTVWRNPWPKEREPGTKIKMQQWEPGYIGLPPDIGNVGNKLLVCICETGGFQEIYKEMELGKRA